MLYRHDREEEIVASRFRRTIVNVFVIAAALVALNGAQRAVAERPSYATREIS